MAECPDCLQTCGQMKAGKTASGRQRYKCNFCKCKYTHKPYGYSSEERKIAIALYLQGFAFRRIGRILGTNHQTIISWINVYLAECKIDTGKVISKLDSLGRILKEE